MKPIIAALGPRARDGGAKDGERLRVLLTPTADGKRMQPVRVVIAGDTNIEAVAALSDLGKYVAVDVRSMDAEVAQAREEEDDDGKGVRLYQSLYETALRNQVPRPLIEELIAHLLLRCRFPAQGRARRFASRSCSPARTKAARARPTANPMCCSPR